MRLEIREGIERITEIAKSAESGTISLDEFHKAITPKTVLNLLKLLNFAEEDIRSLQDSVQDLDMGMFELADLFGDDKTNLPRDYPSKIVERVRELIKHQSPCHS